MIIRNYCKAFSFAYIASLLLLTFGSASVRAQSVTTAVTGYGKASYDVSQPGKFMKNWVITGPVAVNKNVASADNDTQEKKFKTDSLNPLIVSNGKTLAPVKINDSDYNWQAYSSPDDIVSLDSLFANKDYVYAYAVAELNSPKTQTVFMGVGSDDAIKVWLNGKPVHTNWIPRGAVKDDDFVPLTLVKGSNQLLLKVQDMQGGWAFIARLLDKTGVAKQLVSAVTTGNLEKLKLLIDGGVDVNGTDENGITPIVAAKISGRDDVAQLLTKAGAKQTTVPAGDKLVDNFYSTLKKDNLSPGIALLVAKDGNVLYKKGFGYADVKNKIAITPDTKFRIGSVTKQFTAAAILKLQENKQLNVNDKLSKFIPDFPHGNDVSIHHLLTHTSGIHSYTNKEGFIDKVTTAISPDTLVNAIKKDSFDFKPGDRWMYNNSGYFILGYIISKVSGMSYNEYLKRTFFDPLNMKNTGVYHAGITLEHEAKGLAKKDGQYTEGLDWDMSWAGGAGALYSTVDDLLKWNQALYNGKVLSKQSFDATITPVVLNSGEKATPYYGYGLGISKYRGENVISHSGGLNGFLTQLAYFPDEKLSVVMFTNTSEPEIMFNPNTIAEAFLWSKMEKQTAMVESSAKPKNLQQYAGRYELAGAGVITITNEGDKLYAQISGQAKHEIFPSAEDEFFWKVVTAKLKFNKDDEGEFSQATLYQNGQELKAKKLKEETIVTVAPEILDSYVGKYKLRENVVVTVTKENNDLYAQPTDQSKEKLEPVSDSAFIIKQLNAKVTFVKESGKVTKISLNMNGMNTDLPRVE
ncbi:MAG: serine hydrolase [Ginsengibacter sp.]